MKPHHSVVPGGPWLPGMQGQADSGGCEGQWAGSPVLAPQAPGGSVLICHTRGRTGPSSADRLRLSAAEGPLQDRQRPVERLLVACVSDGPGGLTAVWASHKHGPKVAGWRPSIMPTRPGGSRGGLDGRRLGPFRVVCGLCLTVGVSLMDGSLPEEVPCPVGPRDIEGLSKKNLGGATPTNSPLTPCWCHHQVALRVLSWTQMERQCQLARRGWQRASSWDTESGGDGGTQPGQAPQESI